MKAYKARMMAVVIGSLFFLATGCGGGGSTGEGQSVVDSLPTLRPTAVPPSPEATVEAEQLGPAGITPAVSPTLPPAVTATVTPDLSIEPAISLTTPSLEAVVGYPLALSGRVQIRSDQTIEAAIIAQNGRLLAAAPVTPGEYGTWTSELRLPATLAGQANASVTIFDAAGNSVVQDNRPVMIAPDTSLDRYLELYRPALAEAAVAVAGYYLFFDGWAERPVGFRIGISIWDQGCSRRINRQNYPLRGSGYWQAFIVVPAEAEGETCAVVAFGEEGTDERREIQLVLDVISAEGSAAETILIGNPPPGRALTPGRTVELYGTATGAPDGIVQLTLLLADGTIAATETAEPNRYGYWEADLMIPVELEGEALLTAALERRGEVLVEEARLFAVEKP